MPYQITVWDKPHTVIPRVIDKTFDTYNEAEDFIVYSDHYIFKFKIERIGEKRSDRNSCSVE